MQDPMQPEGPMDPAMAEPAAPEQSGLLDGVEDELIVEMTDFISDYIFVEAQEHVATQIGSAGEDLADTIAAMSYQIMTQASEQVAEISPEMVTFETLIPLATETIDFLIEVANATGVPFPDEQELREESFIKMIEVHMAKVEDDPEQLAIAQEMLAGMMEDGSFAEAEKFIEEKIRKEGGDPAKARAMAPELLQPRPDPVAQGVQQGLMDQGGMA